MPKYALVLICALLAVANAAASDILERLLATKPAVAAELSFARGDLRYIVIPICQRERGEVIPGWPLKDSPEIRKAIEEGRRLITCAEIGPDPGSRHFNRLAAYAERYHQRLLQLTRSRSK